MKSFEAPFPLHLISCWTRPSHHRLSRGPLWPSFSQWGTTKLFTTSAPARVTLWENRALVEAPLSALLAWQESAGLGPSAPPPSGSLSLCVLWLAVKVGKGQRAEVSGSREEGGGPGCECPRLESPAVLPAPYPYWFGVCWGCVPGKEHTWKTIYREKPWQEGEQTESSAGSSVHLGERWDAQQGHSIKTKHLNFGFSSSDRSSLLVYHSKKVSQHTCEV